MTKVSVDLPSGLCEKTVCTTPALVLTRRVHPGDSSRLLLSPSEAQAEREAVGHEACRAAEAGSEEERSPALSRGCGEASQQQRRTRAGDGTLVHHTSLSLA